MRIIPSIDLLSGKCVKLIGGDRAAVAFESDDPLRVMRLWEKGGAGRIHVVNLDGAFGERSDENFRTIRRMLRETCVELQIGGGIRDGETISSLLEAGASAIVVSTRAMNDEKWLDSVCSSFPGSIILSLDLRGGSIMLNGWEKASPVSAERVIRKSASRPLQSIVFTDIAREGSMLGTDFETLRAICSSSSHDVYVAGGIASRDDIRNAEKCGAKGVILGRALYDGRLVLPELMTEFGSRGSGTNSTGGPSE